MNVLKVYGLPQGGGEKDIGLIYNHKKYRLQQKLPHNITRQRIMLWVNLGTTRPVFTKTYDINNNVGPELVKLPPYSPELSLINIQVSFEGFSPF